MKLNLDVEFDVEMIEAGSAEDAVDQLGAHSAEIGCVICDDWMPGGSAKPVIERARQLNPVPLLILCSSEPKTSLAELGIEAKELDAVVPKPIVHGEFVVLIRDLFKAWAPRSPEGFCKVGIRSLARIGTVPVDLYAAFSDGKFAKVLNTGSAFGPEEERKYRARNIPELYFRASESAGVTGTLTEALNEALATRGLGFERLYRAAHDSLDVVQGVATQVGMTPEVEQLLLASVQVVERMVRENDVLSELLSKLEAGRNDYLLCHSLGLSILSSGIATLMRWGSDTTFQKLTLAAYFHDITLTSRRLRRIQELEEGTLPQGTTLTREERDYRDLHPIHAADLVRNFSKFPADAHLIIEQHHERPDGTGHPRALKHTQIAPLAAVFIVAHDLYEYCVSRGNGPKLAEFVASVPARFRVGEFKRIYAALEASAQKQAASAAPAETAPSIELTLEGDGEQ